MQQTAFNRFASLATTVASSILLVACATGEAPRRPQVELPASYENGVGTRASATLDQWWTLYDDRQLDALIDTALQHAFNLREARARLIEARSLRSVALAQYDPQGNLSAQGEYRRTRDLDSERTATTKNASMTLPVAWELDFFGRRSASVVGANADIDAARFEVESVRAATAAEVARALFQVRGLNAQLGETRQSLRIAQALQQLVQARADRGLAPGSEVDRVAVEAAQRRYELGFAGLQEVLDGERAWLIVMTTVAMAAGMVPTALALGEGSEFRSPMAIAVIGGLISSTVLSLVLVPVVYELVDDFEMWVMPKLGRLVVKPSEEDKERYREGTREGTAKEG